MELVKMIIEDKKIMSKRTMSKRTMSKKGISAVVGTVLMIVFVISLGLIVVNWSSKIVGSGIEKSRSKIGTNLECSDVNIRLEKGAEDGELVIKNNDKQEIAGFIARILKDDNAFVDYKNENKKISGFGVVAVDYSGRYQYQNPQGVGRSEEHTSELQSHV